MIGQEPRRVMECRCESILSPQMEYVPGAHHDLDCPMRRLPVGGQIVDRYVAGVKVTDDE